MRATEFVTEANKLTLRDFVVTISPHALDQCYNRSVNSHMVDDILKNMSKVKHNIMGVEPGAAFILHNGLGTGLGVRRGAGNNLTLATVFKTSRDFVKGKHPTFKVDTYPDVKEQTLSEIESIPGWQYSGGKESLQDYNNISPSLLKPLPGGSGFAYAIKQGHIMTSVFIVDPNKNPTDAIAVLELEKSDLPLKGNPLTVETITVDEDYQGRGVAKALYGIVLTIMKRPLIAGSAQTPGGRRNWLSLVNIPGVEVKGVIQLENRRLDTAKATPGSKHEKSIEQTIDQVMELGGQFIGQDKYSSYWAFDVVPGNGQLDPYIKNSLSKIYGYDATTTLLARWNGK